MTSDAQTPTLPAPTKRRVVKAPAVRRAELIDCAQRLFLEKGYERTTINDVIAATGLSKGAFYHHFASKEELLEAIAQRFGEAALADAALFTRNEGLNALERLNLVLALGRDWKLEHMQELLAFFEVLLKPENGVLYHRIVGALFTRLGPAMTEIIAQGEREGLFDVLDPAMAAETLLWLAEGRRVVVVEAMALTQAGDIDGAMDVVMRRVRAEEAMVDRILGLPAGSVAFIDSTDELRAMLEASRAAPR
jgi:AcrR family transcriptional regulator